jgi:hypothetical protein
MTTGDFSAYASAVVFNTFNPPTHYVTHTAPIPLILA